jgi:hypothetical protein
MTATPDTNTILGARGRSDAGEIDGGGMARGVAVARSGGAAVRNRRYG